MRILIACLTLACVSHAADGPPPILLWPAGAPGEKGDIAEETHTPSKNLVAGKTFDQLANVSKPTITVYRPPKDRDTGAAVLVFPGGSYQILAVDMEGIEVCQWLNSIGITGVLVRYRVPARAGRQRYAAPLEDAQRAVGMVRAHAQEWQLDAKRIGILGFSAGGHLGATLSNTFEKRVYDAVDASDQVSCRPDFAVLIYPAFLVARGDASGKLEPEINVTASTPPTFLAQTEDDPVRVENSLFYFLALKNAKVAAEMHLFAKGGHGYGLRPIDSPVSTWPKLAERWLTTIGVLAKK